MYQALFWALFTDWSQQLYKRTPAINPILQMSGLRLQMYPQQVWEPEFEPVSLIPEPKSSFNHLNAFWAIQMSCFFKGYSVTETVKNEIIKYLGFAWKYSSRGRSETKYDTRNYWIWVIDMWDSLCCSLPCFWITFSQ